MPAAYPRIGKAMATARSFLLTVDDGGHFFVATGDELTIGHQRAARADLLFLADVGAEHARLRLEESLHGGPAWRLQPLGGERALVAGQPVDAAGRVLAAGDDVVLGAGAAFQFLAPDPASASARLRLKGGECAGASGVLLLAWGPAGRLRIAGDRRAHVPVVGIDEELVLEDHADVLRLERRARRGTLEACELALPLERVFRLDLPRDGLAGPPVGVTLAPAYSEGATHARSPA